MVDGLASYAAGVYTGLCYPVEGGGEDSFSDRFAPFVVESDVLHGWVDVYIPHYFLPPSPLQHGHGDHLGREYRVLEDVFVKILG